MVIFLRTQERCLILGLVKSPQTIHGSVCIQQQHQPYLVGATSQNEWITEKSCSPGAKTHLPLRISLLFPQKSASFDGLW